MKILTLCSYNPLSTKGKRGLFAFDQTLALKENGQDINMLSLDFRSIRTIRKIGTQKINHKGIKIINISAYVSGLPKKWFDKIAYRKIKKGYQLFLKDGFKPDIIHVHFGRQMGYYAYLLAKEYHIPYVISEHDSLISENKISQKEKERLKIVYENADKLIAVSKPFADKLSKMFSLSFHYIPNIVDTTSFSYAKHPSQENYIFTTAGNLIPRKGFDILLNAFAELKKDCPHVKLNIIGEGPQKENLLAVAKQLNIDEDVIFHGQLERKEINKIYQNSNAFILLSKAETFGVVYIEAMLTGLPVIATRCGGPESFVTDEVGILIDPNNVNQAKDAMKKMMNQSYDSNKINQYVKDNFSASIVSNKIVALIKQK